ncbi:MAG: ribonuclease III [Alphaproteobacteria bacterium]|nr:ribonuclease III [Alphaproteobacteria bacterium]
MKLKYTFKNEGLFALAMTQSGVDGVHNNEKLEFLGDRVLGLSVSALLYDMFPNETEGELARRYAVLVSTDTLANVAIKLELNKSLHHGHVTGGRKRHLLANAMEAVLGAMFLDSGFDVARRFICDIWHDLAAAEAEAPKDSKTKLQEFVQKHANGLLPLYEYMEPTGAAHCPVFTATVAAMGQSATGQGSSKKDASTAAAAALLKKLAI